MGISGTLTDGTKFRIKVTIKDDVYGAVLMVNDKEVSKVNFLSEYATTAMVNTWVHEYWKGVDNPELWAAAGSIPDEARYQQALPESHPDRVTIERLKILIALRQESFA